jgi:hypothetical protein
MRDEKENTSLDRRFLSSDVVQLDMSLMCLTLDLSTIASRQISIASEFGLGNPFTQLNQEVNDDEHDYCSSQNTNTSSSDQSLSASPIATVSQRESFLG